MNFLITLTTSEHQQQGERLFLNPKGVDFGTPEITNEYLIAMQDVWNEFDKEPFQYPENNDSIQQFVTNVLTPLRLHE